MKEVQLNIKFTVFDTIDTLDTEDKLLMQKAIEAKQNSYAPYSNFNVGAAILLDNGAYVLGNNQENAAYPSGMCAERVAIWSAGAKYPNVNIKKMAITASSSLVKVDKPVGPCGACRQTLLEFEVNQKQPFQVLFMGAVGNVIKTNSLKDLLPFSFDGSHF